MKFVIPVHQGETEVTYSNVTGEPESRLIAKAQEAVGSSAMAAGHVLLTVELSATLSTGAMIISQAEFNRRPERRGVLISRAFALAVKNIIWGHITDFACMVEFEAEPVVEPVSRFERVLEEVE